MNNINEKLIDILEVDHLSTTDVLQEFDSWDSLTSLSIIAMIDSDYNLNLTAEQLLTFKTVGDLIEYVKSNSKQ